MFNLLGNGVCSFISSEEAAKLIPIMDYSREMFSFFPATEIPTTIGDMRVYWILPTLPLDSRPQWKNKHLLIGYIGDEMTYLYYREVGK